MCHQTFGVGAPGLFVVVKLILKWKEAWLAKLELNQVELEREIQQDRTLTVSQWLLGMVCLTVLFRCFLFLF